MANVEKALYKEKIKAAGTDSTGGGSDNGDSSEKNKKIIDFPTLHADLAMIDPSR